MFKKIVNITISFLLLISTTGFVISKHYCDGRLVNVAVDHQAKSCCGMEGDCCHNESAYFHVKNNYLPDFTEFNFENKIVNQVIIFTDLLLNYSLNNNFLSFNKFNIGFSPPLKFHTILSFIQVFII